LPPEFDDLYVVDVEGCLVVNHLHLELIDRVRRGLDAVALGAFLDAIPGILDKPIDRGGAVAKELRLIVKKFCKITNEIDVQFRNCGVSLVQLGASLQSIRKFAILATNRKVGL
jgi:hypothetical protein